VRKLLLVVVLCAAGWTAFTRYQHSHGYSPEARDSEPALPAAELVSSSRFACDGRVYCSQMSSCEEATYFLQHCPGTKMDGDHNGIPCERQWCKGP
jgi:hypothetical protein